MNASLTFTEALLYTLAAALVILFTRAFPFVLFAKKEPPRALRFVEKYIPPMVMAVLVVYCLKSVPFATFPYGIPEITSLLFVITVHWKFGNALFSIAGGTVLFMLLQRFL